jgi:hypothetical protein
MIPPSIEDKVKHLARMVASGQSARSWAKQHHCDVEMVLAWCSLPEFNDVVDEHRLRVADHMVGKLMTRAESAIDHIFSASRYGPAEHVRIAAGQMLLEKWLGVSRRFVQTKKIAELKATMKSWEQTAHGGRRGDTRAAL